MIIDLHIHSTFSDGELTPEQIVATAVRKEITIISITDHDEMAGYVKARKNAPANLHVIPGIELNTDGEDGELHILGYYINPDCEALIRHIAWRKEERKQWAQDIIEKLNQLGYAVSLKECLQKATGDIIVRTHIADVLVEKSYFHTSKQAYEKLLKKGADAFVPRAPFTAIQAIDLIHEACGQAFLAHPGIYPEIPPIKKLMENGLDGIEVYHPKHSVSDTQYWKGIAIKYSCRQSGGSDHHGPSSRNPYPIGSVLVESDCIDQWKQEV